MARSRWDGTEYLQKHQLAPLAIRAAPHPRLDLVVTIPAYDEPDLLRTLESVSACSPADGAVELLVCLNHPAGCESDVRARHAEYLAAAEDFAARHSTASFRIHIVNHPALPRKHAGVGLARKLVMDEAVARLCRVGNSAGVIACLDADCIVAPNYLQQLATHFRRHPSSPACSIYYEHTQDGGGEDPRLRAGIERYELYLRYHVHALRSAGFPHAFQTLGSCMAVRADAYQRQGGMNRRQGGEDFHFLSKIIPLGGFSELRGTTVYPSPRISHRAPFGTGRAMDHWMSNDHESWPAYPLAAFESMRSLCTQAAQLWATMPCDAAEIDWITTDFAIYLDESGFCEKVAQIKANAASANSFEKHFFRWLNGLRILKYLHWLRARGLAQVPVEAAATKLLRHTGKLESGVTLGVSALLDRYRRMDREGSPLVTPAVFRCESERRSSRSTSSRPSRSHTGPSSARP